MSELTRPHPMNSVRECDTMAIASQVTARWGRGPFTYA
jgi:hypothetical protein